MNREEAAFLISLESDSRFRRLMEIFRERYEEQLSFISTNRLLNEEAVAKTNIAIGKIQAYAEIVKLSEEIKKRA